MRTVAFGALRSSIADGTVYMDCSTVSPTLSGELAAEFSTRFLALPVLGSPVAVRAGQATYLAGGDGKLVDRLGPVLASLSSTVRRYDTAPMAITAKLTTNLLLLSDVVALAESFAVGRAGGLTDEQLRELLGTSPMVAPRLKNRFEGVLTGTQEGWWTTGLGAKDRYRRRSQLRTIEATVSPTDQLTDAANGLANALDDLVEISRRIHPTALAKAASRPPLRRSRDDLPSRSISSYTPGRGCPRWSRWPRTTSLAKHSRTS